MSAARGFRGMPEGAPRAAASRILLQGRVAPAAADPAFHSVAQGEDFANCKVDKPVTPRLYSPHNGAPVGFGAMARLRSTSLIVVTRHPNPIRKSWGFGGSPVLPGRGIARSPGCLTTESEERETWTAKSLRTASHMRAIVSALRSDETSAVHVSVNTNRCRVASQEAVAMAVTCWTSSKSRRASVVTRRTCDQPRSKSQSNLRV